MAQETHGHRHDPARLVREVLVENPVLHQKVAASCSLERRDVPAMVLEVVRFLCLAAGSARTLTPSRAVDDAWHEFILCTRSYGEFCARHFGCMVHHHPGGDAERHRDQFQETLALYRDHFGDPDARFWPAPRSLETGEAACGGCEA